MSGSAAHDFKIVGGATGSRGGRGSEHLITQGALPPQVQAKWREGFGVPVRRSRPPLALHRVDQSPCASTHFGSKHCSAQVWKPLTDGRSGGAAA